MDDIERQNLLDRIEELEEALQLAMQYVTDPTHIRICYKALTPAS